MKDSEMDALVDRVCARMQARDQQDSSETVPPCAPTCADVVAFADQATEATAQRIYAYIGAHPGTTTAEIVKALDLPTHWFRNPKMLANGKRVTPGRGLMRARAGVGVVGQAVAEHKEAKATPAQTQATRAIAIRVASHLEHALDDGLASGLLYEKAKSTKTLRNLAAQVRTRGNVQ